MRVLLQLLIDIFIFFQRWFRLLFRNLGMSLSDGQLHFIVIGVVFMIMYWIIHPLFKKLSTISIKLVSFMYVLTMAIIVAMAIEVAQFQSGTGVMDLWDVIWSIVGFVSLFILWEIGVFITNKIIAYAHKHDK